MEAIGAILALAIIVEALIEVIKGCVPDAVPASTWPLVGVGLGIALCWLTRTDLLAILGVDIGVWQVGAAVTGVLISRGASFVHDLWQRVRGDAA